MTRLPFDRRSVVARMLKRYVRSPHHGAAGAAVLVALEKWIRNGPNPLPVEDRPRRLAQWG